MKFRHIFSIPPAETKRLVFIRNKLLQHCDPQIGFIQNILSLQVLQISISTLGNYLYDIEAEVACFLPRVSETYEAVVELVRGEAHLATIQNCFRVIFNSSKKFCPNDRVLCVLCELRYQCNTYRGIVKPI